MEKGFSKRNLRRLAAKERQLLLERSTPSCSSSNIEHVPESFRAASSDHESQISIEDHESQANIQENLENVPHSLRADPPSLTDKLKTWYFQHHPTRECVESLLKILQSEKLDVPISLKGLTKQNIKTVVRTVTPGEYFHVGIEKNLLKFGDQLKSCNEILLDIGIDGLPLFKSSRQSLWPILGYVCNIENSKVFLIGAYIGTSKPCNVDHYLHDFISEMKVLGTEGMNLNNRAIRVAIRAFICDAPARSFICGVMGHNSFHGCTRCTQVGKTISNVVTFSTVSASLISDSDFSSRKYISHHQEYFRSRKSELENLGCKMVSQFPLDPMHLIDLGVTRKLLMCLLSGKSTSFKLTPANKTTLSTSLVFLSTFVPKEFSRKPRSLIDIRLWKAVEFRQFILYTGVVVLKDILDDDYYYHFKLLHCAYRLLLSKKSYEANLSIAEKLLQDFVEFFPLLYSPKSVTYNVHNILHITQCVKELGYLQDFSAYKFENFMQEIKRKVKKPSKVLQQLDRKFTGPTISIDSRKLGFKRNKAGLVVAYQAELYTLTLKAPDNVCCIVPCVPLKITKFMEDSSHQQFVIGKRFLNPTDFFATPLQSMTGLGIIMTDQDTEEQEETFPINQINYKYVCLPYESKFVLIPLLHNCI